MLLIPKCNKLDYIARLCLRNIHQQMYKSEINKSYFVFEKIRSFVQKDKNLITIKISQSGPGEPENRNLQKN